MLNSPAREIENTRARFDPRGFTLLELVVVMTIAATIAVVAIARTSTSYQVRQRTAARLIEIDLMHIRDRALSTGLATWARVQPTSEHILYYQTPSGGAVNSSAAVSMLDSGTNAQLSTRLASSASGTDLAGIAIATADGSTGEQWLGFDWRGRPLDSAGALRTAAFAIVVSAAQGEATFPDITVSVTPESGLVRVLP